MCFDKAYEIMELISNKRHVCSLRCVLQQRITQELYAAMVLYANFWALCLRGTFVSQAGLSTLYRVLASGFSEGRPGIVEIERKRYPPEEVVRETQDRGLPGPLTAPDEPRQPAG